MRNINRFRDLRFPLCLFGVLSFLTCCDMIDQPAPAPAEARRYVSADGMGILTISDLRFDFRATYAKGSPRIVSGWDGATRLTGFLDSAYYDPSGTRVFILHVTYVGQVLQSGLEKSAGVEFLNQGLWQGGRAYLPLTDSTAGPVNGWFFRRDYADQNPPAFPKVGAVPQDSGSWPGADSAQDTTTELAGVQ